MDLEILKMSFVDKVAILYHANCYDGFGSAWAAWRKFGDDAVYVPMNYGEILPVGIGEAKAVYFLDYSRPRAELEALAKRTTVTVIDHHKTAQDDLAGLPYAIFDMDHSGAVLSWQYFHPGVEVPELLLHIEDRDLWRFKLEGTKEIHAGLCSLPFDFEVWERKHHYINSELIPSGRVVLSYHEILIERFVEKSFLIEIDEFQVPCANVSMLFSEVPERLLTKFPSSPFACYYYDVDAPSRNASRMIGLRSKGEFDVSEIAKRFGGGGHKNAAGFRIASSKFSTSRIESDVYLDSLDQVRNLYDVLANS
jgi:oligoribonuclease NrnB/cAMP/cGMP phosphodiesterase (DHH superfamily)